MVTQQIFVMTKGCRHLLKLLRQVKELCGVIANSGKNVQE